MRESQGIAFLHQRYRYFLLSAQFLSRENRKKVTNMSFIRSLLYVRSPNLSGPRICSQKERKLDICITRNAMYFTS